MAKSFLNFHHIAKTAGTSVTAILRQFFAHDESVDSGILAEKFRRQAGTDFNGLSNFEKNYLLTNFLNRTFPQPYRYSFGHGNIINIEGFDALTFTFLRQPKNLIYSAFLQASQNLDHDLSSERLTQDMISILRWTRTATFQDYILSDHPFVVSKTWNPQLFSFFHSPFLFDLSEKNEFEKQLSYFKENSDEILKAAKKKLEDMFFVGITEYANGDLNCLLKILGLPEQSSMQKHNVRSNPFDPNRVEALKSIPYDFYSRDLELYEHGLKLREENKFLDKTYVKFPKFDFKPRVLQTNNQEDTYKVSEPLIGTGWQERFKEQDRILVWTGPGLSSTLKLRVSKSQNYIITIGVAGAQDKDQIKKAKVFIDDKEYPAVVLQSKTYPNYLVKIQAYLMQEFELKVSIPFWVNPSERLGATDNRNLGIAIHHISLRPNKPSFAHKLKKLFLINNI